MKTRLAMAVVLLLLLLAQAWGLVAVWRDDPFQRVAAMGKKEASAPVPLPAVRLSLQPPPGALPDLNEGYLFNAERNFAGGGKDGQSQSAGNVGMDKVQYNGSIISADNTRALLSYPSVNPASPQRQGFLRVVVGDTVDGYKVTDILPEKIIFSRGGQKITKLLYDKTKERIQAQPLTPNGESGVPASVPPPDVQTSASRTPVASPARTAPKQNTKQRIMPPPKRPYPSQSDEELRNKPLRKRPEPPKGAPASDAEALIPDEMQATTPVQPGAVQKGKQ